MTTSTLSTNYALRRLKMDDLQVVFELLCINDQAEYGKASTQIEDIQDGWAKPSFNLATDAWGVTAPDGRLVGYAEVGGLDRLKMFADIYVHPDHYGQGIGTHLVRLTEARAREALNKAPAEGRISLNNGINGLNQQARQLLEREGYAQVRTFWRMEITLTKAPTAPQWPADISVRTFVSGQDENAVYETVEAAFSDHWGHLPRTFEVWQQEAMLRRGFDPSWWFIAQDGSEIAGIALCRNTEEYSWVNTLGVTRKWRGQGLGIALLQQAFGEAYRRGQTKVGLAVDAQNLTGAVRLYERAGMKVVEQYANYQKELRAGIELSTQSLEQ